MGAASLAATRSTNCLYPPGQRGPRAEILAGLKRTPGLTARRLAATVGASVNAVRRYLRDLETDGLIQHERQHKGVGAPVFAYRLSAGGEALFPRRYEATLLELLDRLVGREGRDATVAALEEHFRGLTGRLKAETEGKPPARRLAVVTNALAEEGYMAESTATSDNSGTLTEHNCAIQSIAERFPELCAAEARFLEDVLGASVERREHILAGCGCCEYHVRFGGAHPRVEEGT